MDDTRDKIQMDIASQYSKMGPEDCFVHSDHARLGSDSLQEEICAWSDEMFPEGFMRDRVTKLRQEVDEFIESLTIRDNGYYLPFEGKNDPEVGGALLRRERDRVEEEAADVLHLLFQFAGKYGFDLLAGTRKKFEKNKLRTWVLQEDGTHRHVEGGHE